MAWTVMYDVMQWVDANGDPASGYVLKAYLPGTTTPTSIAIDKDGSSPQATITFNAEGKPEVSGNEIVPFIDREYKWAIFRNASDASANSNPFAGFYDNIPQYVRADDAAAIYPTFNELTTTTMKNHTNRDYIVGDVIQTAERSTGNGGGGVYDCVAVGTTPYVDLPDGRGIIVSVADPTICFRLRKNNANLVVSMFGANATAGVAVNTAAIQYAIDYGATVGGTVCGEAGVTYPHSQLLIKNGLREFNFTKSILEPDGTTNPANITTEAALVLDGLLVGGTQVDNCTVSVTIDMKNGDRTAILGDGCSNCKFVKNKIYGFTNSATYNHRGIRLQEAPDNNIISNNIIEGYDNPTQRGLLIELWARLSDLIAFAGFFTGSISRQPTPATRNIITNNTISGGSYACNLQGAEGTIVQGNEFTNQNHRGMWVGNGSFYNLILGNVITEFVSSAILLGYGCQHNTIANNKCKNEEGYSISGEAVININTGSSFNLVDGNHLDAPMNYSVYVATDSSYNTISNNFSKNAYLAGFFVENDWKDTLPTNHLYGRPNYADPTDADPSATSWTFNNLIGTTFKGNVVHSGYTGRNITAFGCAQVENSFAGATATQLEDTTFVGNTVLTTSNIAYCLYCYEQDQGDNKNLKIHGNTFDSGFSASTADFLWATPSGTGLNPKSHALVYCSDNGVFDDLVHGAAFDFTDADTTPDISNWFFFQFNNTGATNVTDFDGGIEGKEIVLRGDSNTTIVYTSGLIRPKGLVNVTGMNSNSLIGFKQIGGIWYETFRNF